MKNKYRKCVSQPFVIGGNGHPWLSIRLFPTSCSVKLSQSEHVILNNAQCLMGKTVRATEKST